LEFGHRSRVPSLVQGQPPGDLEWRRWIVGGKTENIRLLPVMPDRAIVVRPEVSLEILPGQEAVFFVSVPVWVRVTPPDSGEVTLCEEPTVVLSNIWFGDPMSGELCYSVQTRARRSIADTDARPHRAVCPVRIKNGSTSPLDFQRLCLRVQHLKTFDGDLQPWTNEVKVTYRGEQHESRVEYDHGPPTHRKVGELLSEARTPVAHSLIKRSFSTLKVFTGI
jgi:hypothetical protein